MNKSRTKRIVALALPLFCVACSADDIALRPIVDVPSVDSDAYPYSAIDTLELSIARSGDDESVALVSVNVDDSLTLTNIPFGANLVVHLSGRSGGTELAYGRTCPVDIVDGGELLEPHLYFSRLVRWGQGPDLAGRRLGPVVGVSLRDKNVAMLLGDDASQVDVIDPTSAQGQAIARHLEATIIPRIGATATEFSDGALVIGGSDREGNAVGSAEWVLPTEANADGQVVTIAGPPIRDHRSIALEDGSVLVVGGEQQDVPGGVFLMSESAWIYSRLGGELSQRMLSPALSEPRIRHSMTRLGNEVGADVLIIGGLDSTGDAIAQTELFRPLRGAFETTASAGLITPRFDHKSVRLPGGFVLVIGGLRPDPNGGPPLPIRELELYDPVQGIFSPAGILPSAAGITGMSVIELPDGRILLAGGNDIDGVQVSTVLIARFDPIDGVVDLTPTDSLAIPRSGHASVVLCDGTVLVAGGADAGSATERYSPPSGARR